MSFILDPPTLFIVGIILAILQSKNLLSPQNTRILGFLATLIFLIISPLLYLDVLTWPINFDLQPIEGSIWMFHTDYTGIYKNFTPPGGYTVWLTISGSLVVLMFALYPVWLFVGFKLTRDLFFSKKYRILKGEMSIKDVKSASRKAKQPIFSVQRNKDKIFALNEAMTAIGGFERYVKKGDHVVIKANICGGNPYVKGSYADPQLVGEISRQIQTITEVQVVIVDSDMVWTDFEPVAKAQGWYHAAKIYGFKLVNLAKSDLIMFDFGPNSKTGKQLASKIMIDADVLISIPAMKTHLLTSVTLGMKNFYGSHPEGDKAKYHKIGIEDVIVDVIRAFTPTLTIIDGSIGGQAIGPLSVKPVNGETIVVSNDVVLADSISCQIIGYKPEEIVHLWNAHNEGIGRADIQFDFSSLPYALETDGKWERPKPEVSEFYNGLIEAVTEIPTVTTFFNYASDVILYDTATLPILRNLTPITLSVLSDAIAGLLHLTKKIRLKEDDKLNLGHKVADKVFPQIGQQAWPTKTLQTTLETIGLLNINVFTYPTDSKREFKNVTDNEVKASFAETFMPRVSSVGLELRAEAKSKAWSGIQYELVENEAQDERVLQNVLIWTKQKVLFSQFYNLLLPILLGFLGMLIVSSVKDISRQEAIISVLIVSLTLILLGGPLLLQFILIFLQEREIIYRTPVILPIYGLIFLIAIYDIFDRLFSSVIVLLTINYGGNTIEVVLPIVSIVFFSFAILTYLLITLFGNKAILASHYMDYGPIWIYLKPKTNIKDFDVNNPVHWEINKVYFDAYHYEVETHNREALQAKDVLKISPNSERIILEIDNNWHAFSLSSSTSNLLNWLGVLIGIISFIGLIVSPFFYWGTTYLLLILTTFFIILTVSLWLFVARYRSTLVGIGKTETKESLKQPAKQFNSDKLNILWNLREEHAQLKIRNKLTKPFDFSMSWDVFYDTQQKITARTNELEITRSKIINLIIMVIWSFATVGAFIYGNYLDHLTSNMVLFGFGAVIVIALLGVLVMDFNPIFVVTFTVGAMILSIIDETITSTAGLWTYYDERIFFAAFGWPLIMFAMYSIATFIQLILHDPLKSVKALRWRILLAAEIGAFLGILLYFQQDYLSMIRDDVMVISLISILFLLGMIYTLINPNKEVFILVGIAAIIGGLMEIIGNLSGMWVYNGYGTPSGFSLTYFSTEFPLFLFILWILRILTVLFFTTIILKVILKTDRLKSF